MPDPHQLHSHAGRARVGHPGHLGGPTPEKKADPMTNIDEARHFAALHLTTLICDLIERKGAPFSITNAFPVIDAIAAHAIAAAQPQAAAATSSDTPDPRNPEPASTPATPKGNP